MEASGQPPTLATVVCPFAGAEKRDADGHAVTRECETCPGAPKLKVFTCMHTARHPDEVTVNDCQTCDYRPRDTSKAKALLLTNNLCPGDVLCMTAAIYSLHRAHPGKFTTAVRTTCDAIFEHNPDVVPPTPEAEALEMNYPAVHQSNQRAIHQIAGYTEFLESVLNLRIPLATNRPLLYLSRAERGWMNQVHEMTKKNQKYWGVNAGHKRDYSAKFYPWYQEVVDRLQGRILFAQIGKLEHVHRPLRGVINLLDRTDDRQFIRLVANSQGVLCGLTFAMHVAAALQKPCVAIAGGREPRTWNAYPLQSLLSTVGQLSCCRHDACWKSRTVALGDNEPSDSSLCEQPVPTDPSSPRCMAMIEPETVATEILRYQA